MAGDRYYENTVLSIHGTGTEGSTTIIQTEATAAGNLTRGLAVVTTVSPKFSPSCLYFNDSSYNYTYPQDSTGNGIDIPSSPNFGFGFGDFTLECWVKFKEVAALTTANAARVDPYMLFDFSTSGDSGLEQGVQGAISPLKFYIDPIGLTLLYSGGFGVDSGSKPTRVSASDTWYHVAFSRKDEVLKCFIDGVLKATYDSSNGSYDSWGTMDYGDSRPLRIGSDRNNKCAFVGYMQDIRITKGIARYTAGFTPPVAAFLDYVGQLADSIVESSPITDWRIAVIRCSDDSVQETKIVTGNTYSFNLPHYEPYNITIHPKIDRVWKSQSIVYPGDFVVAPSPDSVPSLFKGSISGGSLPEPHYNSVWLLLHCDAANNSTTFLDASPTPKSVIAHGNAKILADSYSVATNTGSAIFDGTGDYLSITGTPNLSADFTIECLVLWPTTTITGTQCIWYLPGADMGLYLTSAGFVLKINGTTVITNAYNPVADYVGSFYFMGVSRSGSTISLVGDSYVDSTYTSSASFAPTGINIGSDTGTGNFFTGQIDEIRVTEGVGRYSGTFTVDWTLYQILKPSSTYPSGINADMFAPQQSTALGVTTGVDQPAWPSSGTVVDGGTTGITWTYIGPLIDPLTIGPKIPS